MFSTGKSQFTQLKQRRPTSWRPSAPWGQSPPIDRCRRGRRPGSVHLSCIETGWCPSSLALSNNYGYKSNNYGYKSNNYGYKSNNYGYKSNNYGYKSNNYGL